MPEDEKAQEQEAPNKPNDSHDSTSDPEPATADPGPPQMEYFEKGQKAEPTNE